MKKIHLPISLFMSVLITVLYLTTDLKAATLAQQLSGKILLQVQQKGEAWYVEPESQQRYFMGRPADAFQLMRSLGVGITDADLNQIPKSDQNTTGNISLKNRLSGKILLQVQQKGEAWYVNPNNKKRYYLGRPTDAFSIMRSLGLGITDNNLNQIKINPNSLLSNVQTPTKTPSPVKTASCNVPTPPNTTNPTKIVGDGNSTSCTESAFKKAIAEGGIIKFNCGSSPHTITLSSAAHINTKVDTIIDGDNLITLSGGQKDRILYLNNGNFDLASPTLTVMNLTFRDGKSTGSPMRLGTDTDGGGGAIHFYGGKLQVFNATFIDNKCPGWGPDLAGGAIYGIGEGSMTIVNSTFEHNSCSNGGALGALHPSMLIYNSTIKNNQALGKGANSGSGDTQVGHGGNGGGILMDGDKQDLQICGSTIDNNTANALGGGIFRTTYYNTGTMIIDQSTISNNFVNDRDNPNDNNEPNGAGGIFFMGGPIIITDSAITGNSAYGVGGGIQLGFGHTGTNQTVLTFHNVEFTSNISRQGLGGALYISPGNIGTISDSNFSYNSASGSASFSAVIDGGAAPDITLSNSKILHNTAGNDWNPISCRQPFKEGGGNYQFPVIRPNGESDYPKYLCSPNITIGEPKI